MGCADSPVIGKGMLMLLEFMRLYRYFGLAGSLIILIAAGLAAVFYVGRQQERYSILNHFISELGERGVSRMAYLFNGGLIIGGLTFIPFMIGLSLSLGSLWGKLGLLAGLGTSGACIAIGFLPMNRLEPHTQAAMMFFRLGLATVSLFSVAIAAQPAGKIVVPHTANIFGGLAVLAYASFLILLAQKPVVDEASDALSPPALDERPRLWLLAVLEWAIFFTTLVWFLGVALTLSG